MTEIMFLTGIGKIVDGSPEEVAQMVGGRPDGPIRLTTNEGRVLFVNWSNVLYLEPSWPPSEAPDDLSDLARASRADP